MSIRERTTAFCGRFGLRVPILLAPLAGASAPALSIAVANAGGPGACGALLMTPPEIVAHRGCFDAGKAEREMVGLASLVPAVVDAVRIPVVATGGIADGRGVAAALALGASAAQVGTGFLRAPEAGIHAAWAEALAKAAPEDTVVSRVFSGRAGRHAWQDRAARGTQR
jgi:nitronate monooxygenase